MQEEKNTCQSCGALNYITSNFCIKCGAALTNNIGNNIQNSQEIVNSGMISDVNLASTQSTLGEQSQAKNILEENSQIQSINQGSQYNSQNLNNLSLNYLMFIIAMLLKPFQTFKEEEGKLVNTKTGLILSGIVAGAMMLINLLKAMISAIFAKSMDYTTFEFKTTVDFSRLQNLDYLDLIGKNLLIYAGVILAITLVYLLASLVVKKQINFIKMLNITTSSIIPFVIIGMLLAPILGKIYNPLSIIATIIGAIYSIVIFITLVKEYIIFEKKDIEIYFHSVCISILGVAAYYFIINLIMSSITSGITDQIGNYLDFLS